MKVADLYIRVGTDEQADKGYSQRSQEELLRRYCEINKISVRKFIFEDHSAKTFARPEWNKYLLDLRKRKNQADLIQAGVEPQAIEQPLNLTIPFFDLRT